MTEFIPRGYISVREALNHLGRELFSSEWTGEEYRAPRGLISEDEWLRIKDLAPARGSGAPGAGPVTVRMSSSGDPSSAAYQAAYRANKRYEDTCDRLRILLEGGDLEAAILDPFTGIRHRASTTLWRRSDAERMIKKGQAPIPRSPNTGTLVVKEFREPSLPARPMSTPGIEQAIKALQEKMATESLTRAEQTDFVRKNFPSYHVTERQLRKIFRSVTVQPGRPRKSDKAG
jgi:hypothetical protein